MNRVWLFIPMLIVCLAGSQWLAAPARGDNDNPYPSADAGSGQDTCPYQEKMRAYGECQWYSDQGCHHGTMPQVAETATDDAPGTPAVSDAEGAAEAMATPQAPATGAAAGPADCWYDGSTDSYHDYEFSNTDMIREDAVETPAEAVESYAAEAADAAANDDWNGSYEFPSETAASPQSDKEASWVEDLPEANSGNESITCEAESSGEQICPESAPSPAPTSVAEDAATEEAWHGDGNAEYRSESAYPSEGAEYPYGSASEAEMADTQSTQAAEASESSEDVMEGTHEEGTVQAQDESPTAGPTGEYEYSYGGEPYHYKYYPDTYTAPVPTWEDSEPGVQVVEGEDSEEVTASSAASATPEFDGEVILSLARTLDRVGVTLQSISRYLTQMATADLAKRHGESLER